MAEIESDYATTILTSNPPEQVARILPSAVEDSTKLIRDQLLPWLTQYQSLVTKHTDALRKFSSSAFQVEEGNGEHGGLPRILKCANLQLAVQIANNERLVKELRSQVITPLVNLVEKDARFLALMIYSEELRELSSNLKSGGQNAEVEWGTRAPQIIDAFANYKEVETQLLFDVILNYFQAHGVKWQNELKNNENSINYLLKTYSVPTEMESYLKYVVERDFAPASDGGVIQQERRKQQILQQQNQRHATDTHSIVLDASKNGSLGKTSKLKSKMGSLFGRKKKTKGRNFSESIPESEVASGSSARNLSLASSRPTQHRLASQQSQATSTLSHAQPLRMPSQKSQDLRNRPTYNREQSQHSLDLYTNSHAKASQPSDRFPTANYYTQAAQSAPAKPETATTKSSTPVPNYSAPADVNGPSSLPLTDVPPSADPLLGNNSSQNGSPNFVRYASLQSTESSPKAEGLVRRKSLLEQHDLTEESVTEAARPANQSSGKQVVQKDSMPSFEAGDDSEVFNTSLDPAQNRGKLPSASPFASVINPPMPPPARKVVHHDEPFAQAPAAVGTAKRGRHDIVLTLFQDMPNARHSVMMPPQPLQVQTTGNSLLRRMDVFKHSELSGPDAPPGLNASVAEVINANFNGNELVKAQIVGEIALSYNGDSDEPITIEIPRSFGRVILNPVFVEDVGDHKFKVLPGPIRTKTLGAIKYLVDVDLLQLPVGLQHAWRYEDHQSSVMINLYSNSEAHLTPLELHDLVVSIALNNDVVTSLAMSKPQGLFSSEKNRITWRYPAPLKLSKEEQLIARFHTNGKGSESEAGLQIKFRIPDHTSFDLITADGLVVPISRNLVSGSYAGHDQKS